MKEPHDTIEPCCPNRIVVIDERHTGIGPKYGKICWQGRCLVCGANRWYFLAKPDDPNLLERTGDDPTYKNPPASET